jgi:hypothetical protein
LFILVLFDYPPICTVGDPTTITPPWAVMSPTRAAGLPPMSTVPEPVTMVSGGPAQTSISPITAAGMPPISTVLTQGPETGPPTWGEPPGFTIGQVWLSEILAAAGMMTEFCFFYVSGSIIS